MTFEAVDVRTKTPDATHGPGELVGRPVELFPGFVFPGYFTEALARLLTLESFFELTGRNFVGVALGVVVEGEDPGRFFPFGAIGLEGGIDPHFVRQPGPEKDPGQVLSLTQRELQAADDQPGPALARIAVQSRQIALFPDHDALDDLELARL